MSLGEKIAVLRKKEGWSQEELAGRLDISRQSVSKWESGASTPELDKIVRLSELFHVSADYLLKEDAKEIASGNEETPVQQAVYEKEKPPVRKVTYEIALEYMELARAASMKIATGVSLCIISPVLLILLGGLAEETTLPISDNMSAAVGLGTLILLVAAAVVIFIVSGMPLEKYAYLEKEQVEVDSSAIMEAQRRQQDFTGTYRRFLAVGVVLCILSVLPLLISGALEMDEIIYIYCVCFLLVAVAVAVYVLVWSGTIWGSYQKLLQEGDYTPEMKRQRKKTGPISTIYWCTVTAIYLGISFYTMNWERSWIIWPCAGVLFGAVACVSNLIDRNK